MIIGYDRRPSATVDQKLQSLMESVQLALNEIKSDAERQSASSKSGSQTGGDHSVLTNRDIPDQHPISAITGLQSSLNTFITSPNVVYATCSTAAGTAAKVATIVSGTLTSLSAGDQVIVKFTNANTKASPTLQVGSTAAKSIMRYGSTAPSTSAASSWNAGSCVWFVYDGTYWQMAGWINTTYSTITDAEYQAGTSTSSRLMTPARLKNAILYHAPVKSVNGSTGAVTITVPTNLSDLNNDSDFVESTSLAAVATSGDYDDLTNTPIEPMAYVTDQGVDTVTGWRYRKWSDNMMELWYSEVNSSATNTSDGGGYVSATATTPPNFPWAFASVPDVQVTVNSGSVIGSVTSTANPTVNSAGSWKLYRYSSNSNTGNKTFNFYVIGTKA